ncbi:MAG: protein kinase [Myxococcota bacterium]
MILRVGDRLGDYEVLAPLSAGGMGTLYLARRSGAAGFSRPVAIKVLRPELLDDDESVRMFVQEAHLCAYIRHPNVVQVEHLGEARGSYYLVMEYVHGLSLRELTRLARRQGKCLAPHVAAYIVTKVAAGLHGAHEARDRDGNWLGVVHRDVSPSNVLISVDGHVKLIDFGIARARSRDQTAQGVIKGKLRYMPPEQARGETVDRRADVFSLGVLAWELFTTRRMHEGLSDLALLGAVREPMVTSIRRDRPNIREGVDAAIMRALESDREERFATARGLAEALQSADSKVATVSPYELATVVQTFVDTEALDAALPRSVRRADVVTASDVPPPTGSASAPVHTLTMDVEPVAAPVVQPMEPPASPEPVPRRARALPWIGIAALVVAAAIGTGVGLWSVANPQASSLDEKSAMASEPVELEEATGEDNAAETSAETPTETPSAGVETGVEATEEPAKRPRASARNRPRMVAPMIRMEENPRVVMHGDQTFVLPTE